MSSPTPPFTDHTRTAPLGAARSAVSLAGELAASEGSRAVGLIRSTPPEEVLDQMARADAIHEALRERGYRVGFALSADAARLRIELRGRSGELLQTLSAAEAVALAAGRALE